MSGCSKIYYDCNYFKRWTNNMAYILGFCATDGNVYKSTLSIELQERDMEILEFIKSEISPDRPIELTNKKGKHYCRLRINSSAIIHDLSSLGVHPAKSRTVFMPENIPSELFGDYLRGAFDGDGYVYVRRNGIESSICSASEKFLASLRSTSGNIGRIRTRYKRSESRNMLYCWDMDTRDTESFRELIYSSGGFSLKRKKAIFFSDYYIPSSKFWTEEEKRVLTDNYTSQGDLKELSKIVGRSYKAVSAKIWRLGLNR